MEGNCLVVGRGILKYGDFLYLLQEARVSFAAENRTVVLKAVFIVKGENPDYLSYQVDFLLDQDVERQESRVHPQVLTKFAKEMQGHGKKSIEDVVFCYQIQKEKSGLWRFCRFGGGTESYLPDVACRTSGFVIVYTY